MIIYTNIEKRFNFLIITCAYKYFFCKLVHTRFLIFVQQILYKILENCTCKFKLLIIHYEQNYRVIITDINFF